MADDGEPEPESAVRAVRAALGLTEALEHVREELGLDARAGVGHRDQHLALATGHRHHHAPAPRRELDAVGQEIPQHLLEAVGIAEHHREVRIEPRLEDHRLGERGRLHRLDGGADHPGQAHRPRLQAQLAGDDAGDVEEILDELPEGPGAPLDGVERALRAGRVEVGRAQEVRPVEQRLQRAAQLVGDGGEELVLHPARAFGLGPHLVLVREQSHVVDRDARVLREQAEDGLAAVGEGARRPPVHVEEALRPALHHDRHDQGGDEPLHLDQAVLLPGDAGVPPDVVAAKRLARLQHEAARAAAGLDDQAILEAAVLPGPVAHDDRAAVGLAQRHAGEVAPAELLGPVDHPLEDGAHVVRRVDGSRQLRQHLRLPPAALRLDEERRVVHRHRGLDREPLEGGEVFSGERLPVLAPRQHQDSEQATAARQGHRHRMVDPEAHHRGQRVGRARVVVGEQAVPGRRAAHHEPARFRERGLLGGLAPAPGAAADGVAFLVHQVGEAASLEEPARPLDDQAQQPVEVELRAQVALHRREGLEMRAPGGLEREQPRVLQRDRGLVGEVLQPPDLLGAEGAAGDVADREHPGHPAADGERHREHRAVPSPLDQRPGLRVQHHARIGQDVRRRDRGSLAHRQPGHQLVARNDGARREDPACAGGGDRHEPP